MWLMVVPNQAKAGLLDGSIDPVADTLRVLLLDASVAYSFDLSHNYVSDVLAAGSEMAGTGYSRKTLMNGGVTRDDADGEGVFDADDVTWAGLDAGTVQAVVVYKQVGGGDATPGDDPVLVVLDDDTAGSVADLPLDTNGSDVTVKWSSEGILNLA